MKYLHRIGLVLLLTAIQFSLCFAQTQTNDIRICVKNPVNIERRNETISVKWSSIISKNKKLNKDNVAVYCDSVKLVSQVLIYGGDKKSDELIFQSGFAPKEKKEFLIKSEPVNQKPVSQTDARFVSPREDLAWENDRIAFRMYGPALSKDVDNGIDVWTKRVKYLIVEKWYHKEEVSKGKDSYHKDTGEGADFFSVGRTLGAGSSALLNNDTLCQPGVFNRYKVIATGPVRACFELYYDSLFIDGKRITETKRISLDAGENLNKIEVTYKKDKSKNVLSFAAGLVMREGVKVNTNESNCWLSLWGLTTKSEEEGYLGLGLIIPRKYFRQYSEDKVQQLMKCESNYNDKIVYYTGAGWTLSGDFKSADDWNNYLSSFSARINAPLIIEITN